MPYYIPEDLALYNWSLDWRVPIFSSLIYAAVVTFFSRRNQRKMAMAPPTASRRPTASSDKSRTETREGWTAFKIAVVAHNIFLTIFSGLVFYSVFPLLLANFRYRSCYDGFCDVGGWVYRQGLGFWAWIFYLSKYYELIDTAILLIKGRPSSFLQTYHHAGAIITMWMLCSTRAFSAWVFVCFNSFIHTLMYFYYTLTCFGYQPRWKRLMTYLQITQFLIGLPMAAAYLTVPGCVPQQAHPKDSLARLLGVSGYASQVSALGFTFSYVAYLIVLFVDFARRAYFSKPATAAAPTPAKGKKIN